MAPVDTIVCYPDLPSGPTHAVPQVLRILAADGLQLHPSPRLQPSRVSVGESWGKGLVFRPGTLAHLGQPVPDSPMKLAKAPAMSPITSLVSLQVLFLGILPASKSLNLSQFLWNPPKTVAILEYIAN